MIAINIVSEKLKIFHFPTDWYPVDAKIPCPQDRAVLYLAVFHQHTAEICSEGKVWSDINVLRHSTLQRHYDMKMEQVMEAGNIE